jgi:hypothetical protein
MLILPASLEALGKFDSALSGMASASRNRRLINHRVTEIKTF